MGIQERFEKHWLGALGIVAVVAAAGAWGVLNEVLVRPRDEELMRLERRLAELDGNHSTAPDELGSSPASSSAWGSTPTGQRPKVSRKEVQEPIKLNSRDEAQLEEFLLDIPEGATVTILLEEYDKETELARTLLEARIARASRVTVLTRDRVETTRTKTTLDLARVVRVAGLLEVSHVVLLSRSDQAFLLRLVDAREEDVVASVTISDFVQGDVGDNG